MGGGGGVKMFFPALQASLWSKNRITPGSTTAATVQGTRSKQNNMTFNGRAHIILFSKTYSILQQVSSVLSLIAESKCYPSNITYSRWFITSSRNKS